MNSKLVLATFLCVALPAFAETSPSHRTANRDYPQKVMSAPCPYNCNSAGYSHWGCAEWKKGDSCYIGPAKGQMRARMGKELTPSQTKSTQQTQGSKQQETQHMR